MLISHKYKFIFLKAFKVSGTSTEAFLERYCLSDDEEKNHLHNHKTKEIISEFGIIGSRLTEPIKIWYNHKLPSEIKNDIGEKIWNSYKKICNIRNPYDIAVSSYFYENRNNPLLKPTPDNFETFLKNQTNYLLLNKNFWLIDGKFSIDYYIKQENLKEELENLISCLNLPFYDFNIPKYKISENRPHYSELYNENTKKIIQDNFGDVLNYFNYSFKTQ